MDASAFFRGKKITVMGLGLLGRGVGDAKYLASCGADLIITDLKSEAELKSSLEELQGFENVTFVLGEHRLEDFKDRDYILKAAGVPLDSPYIAEARKNGIPVKMSASWFAELAQIPIVGVTGTRGKSTTTHMLHAIMNAAGKQVLLGGNVRGISTLSLLPQATPEHWALFELDSWQLQGFGDEKRSPHIAVFTTFFNDHLNYYHNDLDLYLNDKAQIFLYQTPRDTLVLGEQCAPLVSERYGSRIASQITVASDATLPSEWQLRIPGEHNRYDAGLALAAARSLGIADEVSKDALEAFKGVPGRLELVRTYHGISFYNDTTATTPDAALAALRALSGTGKGIHLIMGGADKGLDMSELLKALPGCTKQVYLLAGSGTDRIKDKLGSARLYTRLVDALTDAMKHAQEGDAVLLSPAFASFGMFANEYDRGDQFVALVEAYED